ncbi:MAG: PilZ domain-containing protein [Desulfobacterales bacterium]|nr:PilZ domain-containing protein [Desulfobacterales bacterium]
MNNIEKIEGKPLRNIIEKLHSDRIILTIRVLGKDFERLTMITGIKENLSPPSIYFDLPVGFKQIIKNVESWRLYFECTGKDKIVYKFKTTGGEVRDKEILVPMPAVIERRQRRQYFRVEAPSGTMLFFDTETNRQIMNVIDISQRGVLADYLFNNKNGSRPYKFYRDREIRNADLIIKIKDREESVHINKIIIRRSDKSPQKDIPRCGLQFVDIDRKEERRLVQLIYDAQRMFLQKRLFMQEQ